MTRIDTDNYSSQSLLRLFLAKGKGAVCDCSRQALRDTQIMFVSSNLISPLLGELEGHFA